MMRVDRQPAMIEAEGHVVQIQRLVVAAHGHGRTGKPGTQYTGRTKARRAGGMKADTLEIISRRFCRRIADKRHDKRNQGRSPEQGFHLYPYLCHGWHWQCCRKNNVTN